MRLMLSDQTPALNCIHVYLPPKLNAVSMRAIWACVILFWIPASQCNSSLLLQSNFPSRFSTCPSRTLVFSLLKVMSCLETSDLLYFKYVYNITSSSKFLIGLSYMLPQQLWSISILALLKHWNSSAPRYRWHPDTCRWRRITYMLLCFFDTLNKMILIKRVWVSFALQSLSSWCHSSAIMAMSAFITVSINKAVCVHNSSAHSHFTWYLQ